MATASAQQEEKTPVTPYQILGGETVIRRVVDIFYDFMENDPAYAELRAMHAPDLTPMRASLAGFLTAWSGGPRSWFEQNPGKCMMSLHTALPITKQTADQWVDAMRRAIRQAGVEGDIETAMGDALARMAAGMRRS